MLHTRRQNRYLHWSIYMTIKERSHLNVRRRLLIESFSRFYTVRKTSISWGHTVFGANIISAWRRILSYCQWRSVACSVSPMPDLSKWKRSTDRPSEKPAGSDGARAYCVRLHSSTMCVQVWVIIEFMRNRSDGRRTKQKMSSSKVQQKKREGERAKQFGRTMSIKSKRRAAR